MRLLALLASVAATLLLAAPASAHGSGANTPKLNASELEPGPVKRLILDVRKKAKAADGAATLIEEPIGDALRAADRARGAKAAGDSRNGSLLDKLAEGWAKVGDAVVRAFIAERAAAKEAARLQDLTTKLERADALLTEQQARLGRLQAEVKKAAEAVEASKAKTIDKEKKR